MSLKTFLEKLTNTVSKNQDLKTFAEKLKIKYEPLFTVIKFCNTLNTEEEKNSLFRQYLVSQGTMIGEDKRKAIFKFIYKIVLLAMPKSFKAFIKKSKVKDIELRLLKEERVIEAIKNLLEEEPIHFIIEELAKSLKEGNDFSEKFINLKQIAEELQYFLPVTGKELGYKTIISWAKDPFKFQNQILSKENKNVDFPSILMSVAINIFRTADVTFQLADFIKKAGNFFIKLAFIHDSEFSKMEATAFFNTFSEKEIRTCGEILFNYLEQGKIIEINELEVVKKGIIVKIKAVCLNPDFVHDVFDKAYNANSFPHLAVPQLWCFDSKQKVAPIKEGDHLISLIANKTFDFADETVGSYLEVTQDALNILNRLQQTAFQIDKKLLYYFIDNLKELFEFEDLSLIYYENEYNFNHHVQLIDETEYKTQVSRAKKLMEVLIVALMLKDNVIYFTALLDFRARCYFHSYGIGIQESRIGRNLLKLVSTKNGEDIHMDAKSSVLQIMLGLLNDPKNRLHLTNLYISEQKKDKDLYEQLMENLIRKLNEISPKIAEIKQKNSNESVICRNLVKSILITVLPIPG